MGQAATGRVFHELRVEQICQVSAGGQTANRADQFGRSHPEGRPGQQYGERQPPRPTVQQQDQQAAECEVGQVTERVGPTQHGARTQWDHQYQGRQGDKPGTWVV